MKRYFHVFNAPSERVEADRNILFLTLLYKEKVPGIIFLSFELELKQMHAMAYVPSAHWLRLKHETRPENWAQMVL